ncbi:MAG: acriflavine resistance protein B, partial [Alphaproteobacteria bacterium]|nr:acriflavine resistance protein B [Alphaproteobacteria bacterium]
TLRGTERNVTIEASGQLRNAADYGAIIISSKNAVPVKLEDIATVRDSVENDQTASWFGKKRSIVLAVFRQSDANTVDVVDQVKSKLPQYRNQLPASIGMDVLSDRSLPIREAVADVEFTLGLSIILVVLVIFLFLKSLTATIIPALALPVSLIGTFAAMYVFGYSIDNISLLALTLSVGFVVDDAIVMLENIMRHIENGEKPFDAALRGSREIGFTIISITLSLVAVFIPVFFMGGVVGRVFREFAGTISVAILVSGFVSLTLTPMICARILREHRPNHREGLFARIIDAGFNAILRLYQIALDGVIRIRFIVLLLTLGTIALTVWIYFQIPKGFFPQEDTGLLRASVEAAPDVSFSAMADYQLKLNEVISKDPAIDYFTSSAGFGSTNQAFMFIQLKPRAQRDDMGKIIGRLRKAASSIPGINAVFLPIQNFNLNAGRLARAQYQYTMQSGDLATLFASVPKILEQFRKTPELRDVTSDLQIANPQIVVDLDREKAANLGVTSDQVRQTLYNAFGSRQISTIYTASADYAVILEANRDYQSDPAALSRLFIKNSTGQNVPLEAVANIRRNIGPLSINRQSQQPAVTLSFNLAPDVALGQAVEAIRKAEKIAGLPSSIVTGFAGSAQQFQDSLKGQGPLILAAVLVIYIVLGVLYESFIHPITILSGLPSAGLGALLALQYYKLDLSVIAIIGILMLFGIVKKNAIMMVDFAIERRQSGMDALSAIRKAALVRFRPIMMTTFAALFGTLPIALGSGVGSELRQPLGIAVVGGLAVSQLLTLFITPVVYIYLDKIESYFHRRTKTEAELEPQEG